MEAVVLDEGGRTVDRQAIFTYFQTHKGNEERCAFLKNAYTDTPTEILVAGTRVGYQGQEGGLLMWEGAFPSRTAESLFSWGVMTEMTEHLMERGAYQIGQSLQNAPDMMEQLALFDMGGSAPIYEAPDSQESFAAIPAREVPQTVIDQALYTGGNEEGSVYRVAAFYMREHPEEENVAFLQREFGLRNGRGIELDGRRYAVWFTDEGIKFAEGSSVRTGRSPTTVTWEQASGRILELLNGGVYLSQEELDQVQEKSLGSMADALLMTARELTEEARATGLFPQTLAIHDQPKGYPDLEKELAAFANDEGGLAILAQEYHTFLEAYANDRHITRFRVSEYNTHRIETILDGVDCPKRTFAARPDFLRQCKLFITQDEIEQSFLGRDEAAYSETQLRTYSYFCYPHTPQEKAAHLKDGYGIGGGSCSGYSTNHGSKGYTFTRAYARKSYDEVQLSWNKVAQTINRLIDQKRYPNEVSIAHIPEYEGHRLAASVYHAFYNAPDETIRPYPKGADYYAAVPVIEAQLSDPAKVQEILTALNTLVDSCDSSDRHYDSRVNGKKQLNEFANGTFSLFNGKHGIFLQEGEKIQAAQSQAPEREEASTLPFDEPEQKAVGRIEDASGTELAVPPLLSPILRRKEQTSVIAPLDPDGINYRIEDDALGAGTPSTRYTNNVTAIRLLHELETEGRSATAEEQSVLAQYVGWGGLADCFDSKDSRYEELKALLDEGEYASARESTLTAFYTPPVVIRAMYNALAGMGFSRGNILEPACGTGNFLGMLPESMTQAKLYGVELDSISGRIARQLYPTAGIAVQGYEKTDFPDNFFDVAIGNVPFGQFKVPDRRYDKRGFSIHEYFFAKALDKVRPGGVVAFITSSYTMDKKSENVRRYLAQRADLLGAIRLPEDTFKANAGTEVVSDILFLQKRDRIVDIEPEWVHLTPDSNGIQQNRYFIDHPDMILGEMKLVSGPYGPQPTCAPYDGKRLEDLLAGAIANIHAEIAEYDRADVSDGEDKSIAADPDVRNFSYTVVNDVLYYRENSRMNLVDVSKTAENRIRGQIQLRDCVRTLIAYQLEDYPEEEIKAQQQALSTLYDKFTTEYGLISSRGNSMAFSEDSSYFLLCSLEVVNEDGNLERKADLFTKRTIRSHHPAEKVDTAVEALAVSIGEKARVDMAYMEQLAGKSEEQLFADLTGVVFLNPDYAENVNEKYLPADEYLSGNVRQKLAQAKELSANDPQFQINADALTQVQPVDLTASEISVRLGATWISPDVIRRFAFETMDTPRYAQLGIKVHYSKLTGEWRMEGKGKDNTNVKAVSTYGTKRLNAYEIIESSLNLKDVRIFDYDIDARGNRVAVLNKKETAIAQSKQELLKEQFSEWLWRDPERRETICKAYNILFNSNRPREYDGSHITFSGMNPELTLRPHQVNAIAHVLYGGNTLLAHCVGAGKTFEMVTAAMESKRLGLCQKSLFAVPNHLTEQWASDFLQLYPSANLLVATKKDFETKNRKRFCGRIATGEYDAVIIGHSQFEKIPMSVERQRAILAQQRDEILMGISEAKRDKAENFTIKQMEKTRKGIEAKIDKLNDQSRKDDVVTFEELGVDRLFVDESQNFKNLFLYTKMRNVGGVAQTEAQKSADLFIKCRYLDEITGGRGIVFATGTPISNSIVELYTIQRYLQMNALQEQWHQHFDAWASNYGETMTAIELSPEGTGYRAKTRFAKFHNLPELMSTFKNVADIQTADMLNLPVPKVNYHTIALQPSEHQKEMVAALAKRAKAVRNHEVDSRVDNMLLITNDGRKLALDQRLMNSMLPDDPGGKAAKCAETVFEIWQRTASQCSTQMIFCDLSTPSKSIDMELMGGKAQTAPFQNVYWDIAQKLLSMGIPKEEIAFVHNAKSEVQKKDLFAKVWNGQVRILLGSTFKMGAGTNAQKKLIALHHLDCPWRPSDLEQRAGRIIRRGNENKHVKMFKYVTKGTFDAYNWGLVENKQKFIGQIMTSKSPARSADDIDATALSYAEVKALATGNPMIKEKMDLDIDVSKLKLLKASHLSQRYALEDAIVQSFPRQLAELRERLVGYGADIATLRQSTRLSADGFSPLTLMGATYTVKKEAGSALLARCRNTLTPDASTIGSYRGLTLELCFDSFSQEYRLTMIGRLRHSVTLSTDVFGNLQRMDNVLEALPAHEQSCRERMEELNKQLEIAKEEVQHPFSKEKELTRKLARLEELNALLNMDGEERDSIEKTTEKGEESKMTNLTIYQLKDISENRYRRWLDYDGLGKLGETPQLENYAKVYSMQLRDNPSPDQVFLQFNQSRPADFTGHSLTTSDIIVFQNDDGFIAHYVDSVSFVRLPELERELDSGELLSAAAQNYCLEQEQQSVPEEAEPEL